METNKKFAISAIFIVSIAAVFGVNALQASPIAGKSVDESLEYNNVVCVYKNDVLVDCAHNTVTYTGMNHTRNALMGTGGAAAAISLDTLQLSTNATAAESGETACSNVVSSNGLDISAADTVALIGAPDTSDTDFAQGNFSVSKKWTATGTQADIASVCLTNSTSNNIHFARAVLSSTVNLENGDTLNVTYFTKVS